MISFEQIFNAAPEVEASAPGRVNLLGEHTDYNEGFVLPTAIPQQTRVSIGYSPNDRHHFYSANLEEGVDVAPSKLVPEGFARYLNGCIRVLEEAGHSIPPLNVLVTSSVPIGAGLSSSAAIEVAMLRGLRLLLNLNLSPVQIAQLGQQAEVRYAGVNCGILDQMAASLADTDRMVFLDTRTLDRQILPFPTGTKILVIDSGVARSLASSAYNQRRAECEAAARALGVKALRDISDPQATETLPFPLRKRARHVITENNRVLKVLEGVSACAFGELMNASHASLRDDYEVSIPALDELAGILQNTLGVFGARLTGAGFGGACVALAIASEVRSIAKKALARYTNAGYNGKILVG
ncbi:galactokinase [Altericista sp. CCNU0014]|uniref:galactokinase n=1 Tax=Altericista sp. CCNU0014 TaxID=3082949 RepID=UPI0038514F9A